MFPADLPRHGVPLVSNVFSSTSLNARRKMPFLTTGLSRRSVRRRTSGLVPLRGVDPSWRGNRRHSVCVDPEGHRASIDYWIKDKLQEGNYVTSTDLHRNNF